MTDHPSSPARVGHVWLALILCSQVLLVFAGLLIYQLYSWYQGYTGIGITFSEILPFLVVGFLAQFVDAAIGMGFGVISSAFMLALGTPPQRSTAMIHTVEVFGSGLSAIFHIKEGNVDWGLFMRLVAPGILGAIGGALLISLTPELIMRPIVMAYLAVIGGILIIRGYLNRSAADRPARPVGWLGFTGGALDVAGGGGWGPVVGGTLLLQNKPARYVVGTVNVSEFFVTVVATAIFVGYFGVVVAGTALVGLLAGAALGAPMGAMMTRRFSTRYLSMAIGLVLIATAAVDVLT